MIRICMLFKEEGGNVAFHALEKPPAPVFFTGKRIRGTLLISHNAIEEPVFDTVQLLLRGDVTTVVSLEADMFRKTEMPLLRMSDVKVAHDFQGFSVQRSKFVTSKATFSFEMPQTTMLPSLFNAVETKHGLQPLPPSIRIVQGSSNNWRAPAGGSIAGVCDVAYYIETRLFLNGRVICDASQEIIVMPVAETPPPIDPEDLRNEYRLFASSTVGISWRRKHAMIISISSMEPRPLVFGANETRDEDKLPSTELWLGISARQTINGNDSEDLAKPEIADCDLSITLEATTYFLQQEEHSVLSLAEAQNTPFSVVKTTRYKTQRHKFRSLVWNRGKEDSSDHFVDWNIKASVPAIMPSDAPRLPSFVSTLVARRYAFHVQAKLSTEFGICLHNRLRLKVPVQMVHAPLEKEVDQHYEADLDNETKAPVYVP